MVVLNLRKSFYRLVQEPHTWYQHLQKGLKSLEIEPSDLEKSMYYGRGVIVITYVDDCLLFGIDIKEIQKVIKELEENGYDSTLKDGDEDNVFSFLGVSIKPYKESKMLVLNQTGLINKILETVGTSDCNTRGFPTKVTPFGNDANIPHHKERWNYASFIGMLVYLSLNARPEIKCVVHQCARFIHVPRASRE